MGDKWTLLIIRDLLSGRSHFNEFSTSEERIATNILTDRLSRLIQLGLVEKVPSKSRPGRVDYRLTRKGRTLKPILLSIRKWGLAHLDGTKCCAGVI